MKSFKEFLAESDPSYHWFTFTVENFEVHILFELTTESVLAEAKHKGIPLGGRYSAQLHPAHVPDGQEHIHVYERNNKLFGLNRDGSAHDASHQRRIPNVAARGIRDKFPSFTLPPNNFIESAPAAVLAAVQSRLLLG